MKYIELQQKLNKNKLNIFSFHDILAFFPNQNENTLRQLIFQWKGKGWIAILKKGLYEVIYPKEKIIPNVFIAEKLYSPSYVSLETALSDYSIIPEVAFGVTSVTAKPTREFKNKYGFFRYRNIKENAFIGYIIAEEDGFKYKIADPEKALADFIYFRLHDKEEIAIEKERFDINLLKKLNRKKLFNYAMCLNEKTYNKLKDIYAKL